uniref:Transposase Tc1-like domain-containing protein n=1 Tax=Mola mola TaxID=94237 RepID=A0A3Q3XEU1_MOLML
MLQCGASTHVCLFVRLQQSHRETGRVTGRLKSGRHLARLGGVRGTRVSRQTIRNRLHQLGLPARRPARVPDHTTGHRRHRLIVLHGAREHLRWTRNQWVRLHVLRQEFHEVQSAQRAPEEPHGREAVQLPAVR